jgi:hypothetical protein
MDKHVVVPVTRSSRMALLAAAFALLPFATSGCVVEHDRYGGGSGYRSTVQCTPAKGSLTSVSIDTDAALQTDGNTGAYIEYVHGGHWHVWLTCDTATTGLACGWYVVAQTLDGSPVTQVAPEALEPNDAASLVCSDTVVLDAVTTSETDGVWFDAPPGAPLRFSVSLGGEPDPGRFVYWVDGGAVGLGIPADPIDIVPASP